jgi:hypothetical protein
MPGKEPDQRLPTLYRFSSEEVAAGRQPMTI